MTKRSLLRPLPSLQSSTKALLWLWCSFLLLVAAGVHGSSTGVTALWWSPEKPYAGYLLGSPQDDSFTTLAAQDDWRRNLLMAQARWIRWDELMVSTPLALSQLSHQPRFPVINTNIGGGQNMLILHQVPVWHVATLARPSTWGYFLFGAQRGLAWHWWFQIFACFTALYLLLEIVLRGRKWLAALGALWFCGTAYLVCWSHWPAYAAFFIALGCLSAYHLLHTQKRLVLLLAAALLGLSFSGFVMILYPPWQVSFGYLFVLVFAGLFLRDRLYATCRARYGYRLLALFGALAVAGVVLGAYVMTCQADLQVMAATVYPGQRVSLGGDHTFALLFKGWYNLLTIYQSAPQLINQTEAASAYYLFPAVFFGLLLSGRLRAGLGAVGWLLVAYLAAMLLFLLVGLPEALAKLTLLSYVPPYRADAAIGLASILLCLLALTAMAKPAAARAAGEESGNSADKNESATGAARMDSRSQTERLMPWASAVLVALLLLGHGLALRRLTAGFVPVLMVVGMALVAAALSYALLSGRSRIFGVAVTALVVVTTAAFNPLATNLDHIYDSELARQITHFNRRSEASPLWVCYGGVSPGTLVTTLGGRSLSGLHWPPQLALWRRLDSTGRYQQEYNRIAMVQLEYGELSGGVRFHSGQADGLTVTISPRAPILKELGARYVLALGDAQQRIAAAQLPLLYTSEHGNFSIYEIP